MCINYQTPRELWHDATQHSTAQHICLLLCLLLTHPQAAHILPTDCEPQKKTEQADYHKLLMSRLKEQRERRSESLAKKRAIRQASVASKEAAQ